jgi:hypothetical protein
MSNAVLFEYQATRYLWRFEFVTYQGRETFRVWPYYKRQDGEWCHCKAQYVNDALQMSLDDFEALRAAFAQYGSGAIKLVA